VHRARRVAFVAWFVVSVGGCAAITGLDNIQEQACGAQCDASSSADNAGDVAADQASEHAAEASGMDQNAPEAAAEAASDGPGTETSAETSTPEGGHEAGVDAPPDVAYDDAPFDSGCGNLNTTTNCGACGDTCAAVNTSQTASMCCSSGACPGSTNGTNDSCQYTCATGHLDCNSATAPNTDGCECTAPSTAPCCVNSGGDCPSKHINGLNQASSTFWDCVPTGTINAQLALDACTAYVASQGAAADNCQQYGDADAAAPDSYCSGAVTGDCVCWTYSGQYEGQVFDPKAMGASPASDCYYGPSTETFD
jgi:hypothetical protein